MMTINSKKAVAYVRISSQKQVDNESPATQRDAIQRYADTNNIEIVEWFEDIAKSGKNADRDGLQDLLKYCLKHSSEIDYWLVYNMKRASRDNDTYTVEVKLVLRAKGISVRSATEPAVDDTKEGRFMENLLVALGQLDNEGKAEVTIDNMRSLALQGYWQHPPIVGYDIHKILNDLGKPRPTLKPNSMADKVRRVLERFSQGDITKAELTRYAAEVGLRSRYGKKLSEDRINHMLKHPVYAGYVSDRFTEYKPIEGKHEALISRGTFERNQKLLNGNKNRVGEVHLKQNAQYPLKGLLLCHNCTNRLYASAPKTGNGQHSPRYHCARPSCKGLVKSVKTEQVHNEFEDMLQRIKPSAGILKLYKTIMAREAANTLAGLNRSISTLRDELSALDASKLKALQKLTEDIITPEEKTQLTVALDEQKLEKSTKLKDLEQQQSLRSADIEFAITVMERVDKQWRESDLDVQFRFQSMLFPEGLVYDSLNGRFGTSNISPLYRAIPNKKDLPESEKSFLVAGPGLEPGTSWL